MVNDKFPFERRLIVFLYHDFVIRLKFVLKPIINDIIFTFGEGNQNNILLKRFIKSFSFALAGLKYTFKTQGNFRFHLLATLIVISVSFYLEISNMEWLIILLCVGLVLFAELVNTALEALTDLVSPEYHRLAMITKDTAAASVLVLSIMSSVIGLIIFWPYVF